MEVCSEDAAAINLKFDNGAIGTVLLSEVSQGRINRITLEVTGEKKNLWWNSEDNNILNTAVKGSGVNSEIFGFGNGFMDTFRSLVDSFYDDVKRGLCVGSTGLSYLFDGRDIVKLCNAMLEECGFGWKVGCGRMIESIIEELKLVPLTGEGGMYRYLYAGEKDAAGRESYSSIYYLLTERFLFPICTG